MTNGKIYRFAPVLYNTSLKSSHEITIEENGKTIKTTYRLVKGDSELDIRKQRKDAEPIRFHIVNTEMVVEDETTQRFLESRPDFGRNITVFDPLAESKKKLEASTKSINLLKDILSFDNDKIVQVGYVLFGREALEDLKANNKDHLQNKILAYAQEEPEKVYETINDEMNADKLFVGLLIGSGIFKVSVDERYVYWGHNDTLVLTVPNGLTALEAVVDYFASPEGTEVKKEASVKLEKKAVGSEQSAGSVKPKSTKNAK